MRYNIYMTFIVYISYMRMEHLLFPLSKRDIGVFRAYLGIWGFGGDIIKRLKALCQSEYGVTTEKMKQKNWVKSGYLAQQNVADMTKPLRELARHFHPEYF